MQARAKQAQDASICKERPGLPMGLAKAIFCAEKGKIYLTMTEVVALCVNF